VRPEARPGGEVVVYEAAGGEVQVEVRLEPETVWPDPEEDPPRRRAGRGGNCRGLLGRSDRGVAAGAAPGQAPQPGRHHLGRLPGELQARHAILRAIASNRTSASRARRVPPRRPGAMRMASPSARPVHCISRKWSHRPTRRNTMQPWAYRQCSWPLGESLGRRAGRQSRRGCGYLRADLVQGVPGPRSS